MRNITRLFPKLRVQVGEKPTSEKVLQYGFDIKVTPEIVTRLSEIKVGEYLVAYPTSDKDGVLVGVNLKVKNLDDTGTSSGGN